MVHSVSMDRLPAGLKFPAEFGGRIRFDAEARRLSYEGFMSKADFDRLCRLSDDWGYRRPLEELFRKCTSEDKAPKSRGILGVFSSLSGLWLA